MSNLLISDGQASGLSSVENFMKGSRLSGFSLKTRRRKRVDIMMPGLVVQKAKTALILGLRCEDLAQISYLRCIRRRRINTAREGGGELIRRKARRRGDVSGIHKRVSSRRSSRCTSRQLVRCNHGKYCVSVSAG